MYQIRPMLKKEMDFAIQLAANEGWNPGLEDASCFCQTDPSGFLIGILDGRPIGCISAVCYGGAFGFVGFYIVVPEHRGQGYGIQLWNEAMKKLAGHNSGLDGVVEQQANYMKSGFKHAYRNIRYEGVARRSEFCPTGIVALKSIGLDTRENVMAGTDCGFSQGPFSAKVHPLIQWAKLKSLVEGAALASQELWH